MRVEITSFLHGKRATLDVQVVEGIKGLNGFKTDPALLTLDMSGLDLSDRSLNSLIALEVSENESRILQEASKSWKSSHSKLLKQAHQFDKRIEPTPRKHPPFGLVLNLSSSEIAQLERIGNGDPNEGVRVLLRERGRK